jgi:NADP-dependent 3-hydroxy acid dehydrogenase YdfG
MNLKGKTVFITGASSGIGRAIAKSFAREEARLILSARRTEKLDELVQEIFSEHSGSEIFTFELDVRNRDSVKNSIENLPPDWKKIDILVNNAGLALGLAKLHESLIDDFEGMIDTNIKGLLYVTHAIVPLMVERNFGQIINIGSIAGRETYPNGSVYCATKSAVKSISDGLRMDLVDKNIRVANIEPGMVETEFSNVRFHGDQKKAEKVYEGILALQAEDISEIALFIATRPNHVQVCDMLVTPTKQASATVVSREN